MLTSSIVTDGGGEADLLAEVLWGVVLVLCELGRESRDAVGALDWSWMVRILLATAWGALVGVDAAVLLLVFRVIFKLEFEIVGWAAETRSWSELLDAGLVADGLTSEEVEILEVVAGLLVRSWSRAGQRWAVWPRWKGTGVSLHDEGWWRWRELEEVVERALAGGVASDWDWKRHVDGCYGR